MNHSNGTISITVIDRYLAGTASAKEQAYVEEWIAEDSIRRMDALQSTKPSAKAYAALGRVIKQGGASQKGDVGHVFGKRVRMPLNTGVLRLVGLVSLVLTLVVAGTYVQHYWSGDAFLSDSIARTYATGIGQKGSVTLDDGTRVTLAPSTTLRLSSFGSGLRTVELNGEAYFNVRHADGAPFIVRTGDINTRVLGTDFVVRRYRTDPQVRVAVESGKVTVSAATALRPSVVLTAGFAGRVTDSTASVAPAEDMSRYIGWVKGNLTFQETPLVEVLDAITRWYGYEFQLPESSMAEKKLTIVLSTTSIESVWATLKAVLEADLAVKGNMVTLTSRKASLNRQSDALVKTRTHWNELISREKRMGR